MNVLTSHTTIDSNIIRMLMKLFDYWKLPEDQQLILLNLSKDEQLTSTKLRNRQRLDCNSETLERAATLLTIHKSLRKLFPKNRDLAYAWISQPNKAFDGLTPMQLIIQSGLKGMYVTKKYLDNQLTQ